MPHAVRFVVVVLAFFAAPRVVSAQPPPASPAAACTAPAYRQFDFWLGHWTVTRPDGVAAGVNEITRQHRGCVLLETWTGAGGMTGTSINMYNPATNRWHQTWADSTGTLLAIDGEWRDGAMRLEGDMFSPAGALRTRITWRPLDDGRVRQVWETSKDRGQTWVLVFDGLYERRGR